MSRFEGERSRSLAARKELVVTPTAFRDQSRRVFIPCRAIRSMSCGYDRPAFPAASAEVFVVRENRIRVRLDEIELVFGCQAQIDSRVAVDCQQSVNLFTFLVDTNDKRRIELGEMVLQAPAFAIFVVPFRLVGSDLLVRQAAPRGRPVRGSEKPSIAHSPSGSRKARGPRCIPRQWRHCCISVNKSHAFAKLVVISNE